MVSIEEARRQATQARQELSMFRTQVSQRETEISQAEKRIRGLQFPGTVAVQLALASQPGIGAGGSARELKRRRRTLELQKQTGLGQIGIARQELRPSRIAIGERGQQITAFERQIDIATIRQSRQRRQRVASSRRGFQQRQARLKVFTGLGLEPVFGKIDVDGRTVRGITGLKSERLDTIFSFDPTGLASLGIEQPGSLKVLERAEIIDFAPSVTQIDLGQQFLPGIFIPSGGSTNVTSSASNVTGNVSLSPPPIIFFPPDLPRDRKTDVTIGEPSRQTLPPPPSTLPPTGRPRITVEELVGPERFPRQPAGTISIGDLIGFDRTVPSGGLASLIGPQLPELLPPIKEFMGGADVQDVQELRPRVSLSTGPFDTRTRTGIPGFGSAIVQTFKTIGTDIGKGFGLIPGDIVDPRSRFSTEIAPGIVGGDQPFTQREDVLIAPGLSILSLPIPTGETRQEAKTRLELEAGISPSLIGLTSTARQARILDITERELRSDFGTLVQSDISGLQQSFQQRIEAGGLSLAEAQKQFDLGVSSIESQRQTEFQSQFEEEAGTRLGVLRGQETSVLSDRQLRDLGTPSGTRFAEFAPKALEVGALIGASFTPVGATLGGAFLLGTSSEDFGRGILGEDLPFSERALSIGLGSLQAGFGGLFIGSALGPQTVTIAGGSRPLESSLIERQLQRSLQRDLTKQKIKLIETRPPEITDDFIKQFFKGGRGTKDITEQLDVVTKTLKSGKAIQTVDKTTTLKLADPFTLKQSFTIKTEGVPTIVQKPVTTFSIPELLKTDIDVSTGSFGVGRLQEVGSEEFFRFPFVGVSRFGPKGLEGIGGRGIQSTGKQAKFTLEQGKFIKQPIGVDVPLSSLVEDPKIIVDIIPKRVRGRQDVFTLIPSPPSEEQLFRQVIQRGGRKGSVTDLFGRLDVSVTASNVERQLQIQKVVSDLGATEAGLIGGASQDISAITTKAISGEVLPGPGAFAVLIKEGSPFAGTGQFERVSEGLTFAGTGGFDSFKGQQLVGPRTDFTGGQRLENVFGTLFTDRDRQSSLITTFDILSPVQIRTPRTGARTLQGLPQTTLSLQRSLQLQGQGLALAEVSLFGQATRQTPRGDSVFDPRVSSGVGRVRGFGFFGFPPTLGGFGRRVRRQRGRKKRRTRIAPSFTASALQIIGPLPAPTIIGGIDLGILPGRIRKIPVRRRSVARGKTKKTVSKARRKVTKRKTTKRKVVKSKARTKKKK